MPKHFSREERELIHSELLRAGRDHFGRLGFKRASVEEIAQECGISKGTLYSFYRTKEAFFLDVLLLAEHDARDRLVTRLLESEEHPADAFVEALFEQLAHLDGSPIFHVLTRPDEYRLLFRKLDDGSIEPHIAGDRELIGRLLAEAAKETPVRPVDPDTLGGVMRGLTFFSLHRKEIGIEVFEPALRMLLTMVARYLFPGHEPEAGE
ncbi:MAG: TetR/AcrR family transcriptional regulator [Spirochaetota bacterium]